MSDSRQADTTVLRLRLAQAGFTPLPLFGKQPPAYGKNNKRKGLADWQNLCDVTREMVEMWARTWPDACNTGILTRLVPTLDLDLLNEEAARAAEDYVREHFEERGRILSRIGKAPKRAVLFQTGKPFTKIVGNVVAPNGSAEKIEFLAAGQQVVVHGTHPQTQRPYSWHGGEPGQVAREDLPHICEDEARQLVDEIVELLVRDIPVRQGHHFLRKQLPLILAHLVSAIGRAEEKERMSHSTREMPRLVQCRGGKAR
jgi:hypothetical protein